MKGLCQLCVSSQPCVGRALCLSPKDQARPPGRRVAAGCVCFPLWMAFSFGFGGDSAAVRDSPNCFARNTQAPQLAPKVCLHATPQGPTLLNCYARRQPLGRRSPRSRPLSARAPLHRVRQAAMLPPVRSAPKPSLPRRQSRALRCQRGCGERMPQRPLPRAGRVIFAKSSCRTGRRRRMACR